MSFTNNVRVKSTKLVNSGLSNFKLNVPHTSVLNNNNNNNKLLLAALALLTNAVVLLPLSDLPSLASSST